MTKNEKIERAKSLTANLTVEYMKNWLVENANNFSDEIMLVSEWILEALESRMPEKEFVSFCSELEAM